MQSNKVVLIGGNVSISRALFLFIRETFFFKIIYYHGGALITQNNWVRVSSRLSICSDFRTLPGNLILLVQIIIRKNKCSFLNYPKYFI